MNLRSTFHLLALSLSTVAIRGDDFYSGGNFDLISASTEKFSAYALQCTDGALAKVITAEDPVSVLGDMVNNYCDDRETKTFKKVMADYDKCSGEDLNGFIETFWDGMAGTFLYCFGYLNELTNKVAPYVDLESNPTMSMDGLFPLQRIPDECVNALFGDNPLGKFLRTDILSPGKELGCMAVLGHNLPACTLREWPIPVIGEVIKFFACTSSKMEDTNIEVCNAELDVLQNCLPPVSQLKKGGTTQQCQEWSKKCTIDVLGMGSMPSIQMMLPAPLSALPLTDICTSDQVDATYKNVPQQFEAYRKACADKKDIAFWDENSFEKTSSSDKKSKTSSTVKNASAPADNENENDDDNSSGGGGAGSFVFGLLFGVAVPVAGIVYYQRKNRLTSNDFDSLQLRDNTMTAGGPPNQGVEMGRSFA